MTLPPPQPVDAARIVDALAADEVLLPPGLTLTTLADRPDLEPALGLHTTVAWPESMFHDPVAIRLWDHLHEEFAGFQLLLLDETGGIVASGNCAPLAWDGTDAGLPAGWDDQFERTIADLRAGRAADTTGALQIVVRADRQGSGLSALMVRAFRALARLQGHRALIACVRPTWKERYPLMPIERYATWMRADGLPFDPWIRVHARLGARIAWASAASMRIEGTVAEWQRWTGMAFPESGVHVVPRAASTVAIDREANRGVYLDPNVWMVHPIAS